ncbi:MAG: hypothetical protein IRZ21_00910 [Thermoleophilaceae bacterium]|nr:hypothetical protein [Thermoleophilaceae bacterium]
MPPLSSSDAGGAADVALERRQARDRARLVPVLVAAVGALAYVIVRPPLGDMAAHVFRGDFFGAHPFSIWNDQWYGGHHTPAYSVLFPPLAWLLGPFAVGALSAVGAAAAFEALAHRHFGEHARFGSLWFGVAILTLLLTGRLPFALGVAIGLAALLALQRERRRLALTLAVLTPLASPVAGAFLGLVGAALALSGRAERSDAWRNGLALAAASLLPPLALATAFPEGGHQPFVWSAFLPAPLAALGFLVLAPKRESTLRIAAMLYLIAETAAFAIATPMGSNTSRLGALFAGPLAACVLAGAPPGRSRRAAAVAVTALLLPLAYWQWSPAVRAVSESVGDHSRNQAYYAPLLRFLDRHRDEPPARVEVVFTEGHFEAADVARRFPLARGWERQVDVGRNEIFYKRGALTPESYASWLRQQAVRYVAVPDAPLDYSSIRERALIDRGLPYLRLRWRNAHWRVYEFTRPHPFVIPDPVRRGKPARLEALDVGPAHVDLRVIRPGSALLRVRWTPYWEARGACVEPAGQWTRVRADKVGHVRLDVRFALTRIFSRGARCDLPRPLSRSARVRPAILTATADAG